MICRHKLYQFIVPNLVLLCRGHILCQWIIQTQTVLSPSVFQKDFYIQWSIGALKYQFSQALQSF